MRWYTWVPHFHYSIALALRKLISLVELLANLINLPFCRCANFASSFIFYTSVLLGLNKCLSNFREFPIGRNKKKIKVDMEENMCVGFAVMQKNNN